MCALFRKEISSFFSSITGYVVIIVFLLSNSLFMWIFPGELNILDGGYATLDTLFFIAPWVFLFLIPSLTMRMFAEEKRAGTMELLATKPITELQIVLAKYFAGVALVLLSLLPSLIYLLSVYMLGSPVGNIDMGGTWGSFAGLFFLASIYVAIGVFASSISDNQIISFIFALLISFFFYIGFELLTDIDNQRYIGKFIANMGINEHYKSMSRGVLDTRDMVYFISVVCIFLLSTRLVLQAKKW